MNRFYLLPILCCFLLVFQACSKKDKEAPEIQIVSPVDGQSVFVGASFPFTASFSDNEALASYTVDVKGVGLNWETSLDGSLSGTSEDITESIAVDATAQLGTYKMTVRCVDEEGNAKVVELEITVSPS